MTYHVIFAPDAQADLTDMFAHYSSVASYIIPKLEIEIDRIISQLSEFPLSYQAYIGSIRRAVMHTFPYCFYYNISEYTVTIAAVLSQYVDPEYIDNRVYH